MAGNKIQTNQKEEKRLAIGNKTEDNRSNSFRVFERRKGDQNEKREQMQVRWGIFLTFSSGRTAWLPDFSSYNSLGSLA